jgi:hypothetical protein
VTEQVDGTVPGAGAPGIAASSYPSDDGLPDELRDRWPHAVDSLLLALDMTPGSVQDQPNLDGTGSYSAPAARIDLSCGQIRLYAGRMMPGGGIPGPGTPGDCSP